MPKIKNQPPWLPVSGHPTLLSPCTLAFAHAAHPIPKYVTQTLSRSPHLLSTITLLPSEAPTNAGYDSPSCSF